MRKGLRKRWRPRFMGTPRAAHSQELAEHPHDFVYGHSPEATRLGLGIRSIAIRDELALDAACAERLDWRR